MKRHIPQFGSTRPWPYGHGVVQIYVPVDLAVNPEIAAHLPGWRAVMARGPITLVEDLDLHFTMHVRSGAVADEIPEVELDELAADLGCRVAGISAGEVMIGPCYAKGASFRLDTCVVGPLEQIQRHAHESLYTLWGPDAASWKQPTPHVSVGFWRGEPESAAPWQRRLDALGAVRVPLRISEIVLAEVHFSHEGTRPYFRWEARRRIPLAS